MSDARYPRPPIWLLVDGNNQVVTDAHGVGVMGAAAALTARIRALIAHWEPACVITCWDSPNSFRRELVDTYKAGRIKLPGMENAIAAARDDMRALGCGVMQVDGYEADDLIATFVGEAQLAGCRAVMMSRDKDLHQCIVEGEVCQLLKVIRLRTANGRSSDNIKGVPGVGEKTARLLLQKCGSLDGFFSEPWRSGLSARQIAAVLNARRYLMNVAKPLCTLVRDVPLPEMWREAC